MVKYINADQFLADESEAFMEAQIKLARGGKNLTYQINEVVHSKIQKLIADAQSEDVRENIHAKWEPLEPCYGYYRCSKCGFEETIFDIKRYNYCAHCGSDMRGDQP